MFKLNRNFNCNSKNILYLLTCTVCKKQYVGETENCRFRMSNHKKDVRNPMEKTLSNDKHFKNCLMRKYGELKQPLFYVTPFLYVKDPAKRHNLEIFYMKKFKTELNKITMKNIVFIAINTRLSRSIVRHLSTHFPLLFSIYHYVKRKVGHCFRPCFLAIILCVTRAFVLSQPRFPFLPCFHASYL